MKIQRIPFLLLLCAAAALQADPDGYHPDVGDYARIVGSDYRFPFNFGPTGTTGWFYDKEFVINGLDQGSPADGVLKIGDRIRAVNGRRFVSTEFKDDERDPRRALGTGITEAEAGDGKLVVTVWRGGREQDLTITLPVMGAYAEHWPYDCKKSATILRNACQWLADSQSPTGAFVEDRDDGFALGPALDGLLLLSSGDPVFLENARRLAYDFVERPGPDPLKGEPQGTDGWGQSYQATFVAEYYLRTGDTHVRPYLEWMREVLDTGMGEAGGWGHSYGHTGGYAVGGYINPVGAMVLNSLALLREAGIEGDPEKLERAAHYFRRWSYGGRHIHYGDHFSAHATKPGGSGTGKNAIAVVAYEVLDEHETARRMTVSVIDSYRHRDACHAGPFPPLVWGPIGASRGTAEQFRLFMDYWTWFHDLSRRWDGSFLLPSKNGGGGYTARGPVFTMGGQALVYALPLRITRVCGATDSPFAARGMPDALRPIKAMVDEKRYTDAVAQLSTLLKGGTLPENAKPRAELMRDSLATTLESVAHTLAQIEENLEAGDSVLARTRIRNLEDLLGGAEGKLAVLKKQAEVPRHSTIAKAWETYLHHRLPSYTNPDSLAIMKKLAGDPSVGFVQSRARDTLEAGRQWPSYEDSFGAESIHRTYHPAWKEDENDPVPLAVMRLLAFGDCLIWPGWVNRNGLEEAGVLGEFPFSTLLAPPSVNEPANWRYLTMDEATPPARWLEPGFDDSAWAETTAPLLSPTRRDKGPERQWDKKVLLMRRAFDTRETDFDALRIKGVFFDEADIYLNGRHVARVLTQRRRNKSPIDFDITGAGLPALKKGRNVLAVRATRTGGHIDVGLLGVKR